jgi:peptide/nickel transport system permease protein
MYVGLGASALGLSVATVLGVISGYFGGKFDLILQRLVDMALIFPILLMIITLIAVIGQGLAQVIIVMGIWVGIGWIRVIRSAVIAIREEMYLHSAKAIGGTSGSIIMRHVLPNIVPIMIVIFTIDIGTNITAEATLSFLGLGVPPPAPSWGGMLSADGQRFMYRAPWLAIWPGLVLTIVVFGIHVFGDALRDLVDPKLRSGIGRYGGAKAKKRGFMAKLGLKKG